MSLRAENEQDISNGEILKLYFSQGEVIITIPRNSRQFYSSGYTQSTNMRLISKNINLIDRILLEGHDPCWTFSWSIFSETDISSLVSVIEQIRDRKPSSSSENEKLPVQLVNLNFSEGKSRILFRLRIYEMKLSR